MPKLIPLKQWYCDTCGELIKSIEDGWVEWMKRSNDGGPLFTFQLRIIHHKHTSPNASENGCCEYKRHKSSGDHLVALTGDRGLYNMLNFLSSITNETAQDKELSVKNWIELFKRLHLPYHEEAHFYFQKDFTLECNSIDFDNETLKNFIEECEKSD